MLVAERQFPASPLFQDPYLVHPGCTPCAVQMHTLSVFEMMDHLKCTIHLTVGSSTAHTINDDSGESCN